MGFQPKVVTVDGDTCSFNMVVKRDSFATEHDIKVTVDVTGITRDAMLANNFSGSSMRVKAQSKARKFSDKMLNTLAESGWKLKWAEIAEKYVPTIQDAIMELTWEQFFELMSEQFGMTDREQVRRMYCKKHDIEYTYAPKGNVSP